MRMTLDVEYVAVDSDFHRRHRAAQQSSSAAMELCWQRGVVQWHRERVLLLHADTGNVLSECVPQAALNLRPGEQLSMHSHMLRCSKAPMPRNAKSLGNSNGVSMASGFNGSEASERAPTIANMPDGQGRAAERPARSQVVYDIRWTGVSQFARHKDDMATWSVGTLTYNELSEMATFRDERQHVFLVKRVPMGQLREGQLIGTEANCRHVIDIVGRRVDGIQGDISAALNSCESAGGLRQPGSAQDGCTIYAIVYTTDRHKKQRKKWLDGTLEFNERSKKAVFYSLPDEDCIEDDEGDEAIPDETGPCRNRKWTQRKPKSRGSARRKMLYSRQLSSSQIYEGAELEAGLYQFVINEPLTPSLAPTGTNVNVLQEGSDKGDVVTARQVLEQKRLGGADGVKGTSEPEPAPIAPKHKRIKTGSGKKQIPIVVDVYGADAKDEERVATKDHRDDDENNAQRTPNLAVHRSTEKTIVEEVDDILAGLGLPVI